MLVEKILLTAESQRKQRINKYKLKLCVLCVFAVNLVLNLRKRLQDGKIYTILINSIRKPYSGLR